MMIYITNINFNYDGDITEGFRDVSLHFQTAGYPYSINGEMTITKEQYLGTNNITELRDLAKNRIISDLQGE